MSAITYKPVKSLIENVVVTLVSINNNPVMYKIEPHNGYALHDDITDIKVIDSNLKYLTTCELDYDFSNNPRKIYAVKLQDIELPQMTEEDWRDNII